MRKHDLIAKLSKVVRLSFQQIVDWNEKRPIYTDFTGNLDGKEILQLRNHFTKMEAEGLYTENPEGERPEYTGDRWLISTSRIAERKQQRTYHPDSSFISHTKSTTMTLIKISYTNGLT